MAHSLKTIVITWVSNEPYNKGHLLAALWTAEGSDIDLNNALKYARHLRARVHTFATGDSEWKSKSFQAHRANRGL
jgi:hypothetical protein